MALSYINGKEVRINRSRLIESAPIYKGINGQLISKTPDGFLVKTSDSFIEIIEIETDLKLRVGDKL
jgi:methionyl-tRNA formyltransferase